MYFLALIHKFYLSHSLNNYYDKDRDKILNINEY